MLTIHLKGKRSEVKAALKTFRSSFKVLEVSKFHSLKERSGVSVYVKAEQLEPSEVPSSSSEDLLLLETDDTTSLEVKNKVDRRIEMCRQRSEEAQQRIQTIVSNLQSENALPNQITPRAKLIMTEYFNRYKKKLSGGTLYKHSHLWHPEVSKLK